MTMHHPPRWRVALVREAEAPAFATPTLRTSTDVADAFRFLIDRDREEFWIAALDQRHRIIATHQVSIGTLTASLVHPREVVKPLVLCSAATTVLVHNHPSGDPSPSAEDHAITERLVNVCALLGIAVLDHVIIGAARHYSFADVGQLPPSGPAT
ncbi:MAG: JAB domain-containing protein [Kofleriaceae bacterium]